MRFSLASLPICLVLVAGIVGGCGRGSSSGPGSVAAPNGGPGSGPQNVPVGQRIGEIVQPIIDDGWARSMMVGVTINGKETYYGFGSVSDEQPTPPDENTVFEIGSITKVFTAITLAEMASKGEVALDDPVGDLLRGDLQVPAPGSKPITLASLAAHLSGLPNI